MAIFSLPAAAAGISASSSATAWTFGTPVTLSASLSAGIQVLGFSFQNTDIPAVDVNQDILFEITVGGTTKLQIPFNIRSDTNVGYHFTSSSANVFYLPEPIIMAAGSDVAVKVTDSIAAVIQYHNIKLQYTENVAENVAPTTVLNTPANAASLTDTTPDLVFTGTDPDGNDIRYQIQIDTVNTFDGN